jgi:hypothetical protein
MSPSVQSRSNARLLFQRDPSHSSIDQAAMQGVFLPILLERLPLGVLLQVGFEIGHP